MDEIVPLLNELLAKKCAVGAGELHRARLQGRMHFAYNRNGCNGTTEAISWR